MITLSPQDRAQVYAVLMTHAEMQDNTARDTLAIIGRLKADSPDDAEEMIEELSESVELCEQDCDNLKRIASLFGEV